MLLDLLAEVTDQYIPKIFLTNNKHNCKTTLRRSTKSKIRRNHSLSTLYLQTSGINIYNKYCKISSQLRLRTQQSIKIFEKIFVMMLKVTLKTFGSMLTTKGKRM